MSKPRAGTNPRIVNGHRRRLARLDVLATEDVCGICGQVVDKSLHHLDDGAPEVDEVIPVSLGGSPYDRMNLRLTHRLCNRQRGNGLKDVAKSVGQSPVPTSQPW